MDEVRGLDILLMVAYHTFYMAGWVFDLEWGRSLFLFFLPVAPFFAGVFIFICGVSCRLSHSKWKRGGLLALLAAAVSLVMWLADVTNILPGETIWFGILHFLAAAILLFALLRPLLDKIPPWAGILACVVLFVLTYHIPAKDGSYFGLPGLFQWELPSSLVQNTFLYPLGIGYVVSSDYFPLLPWIFCFLAGAFIGVWARQQRFPDWMYRRRVPFFSFVGKHTLLIYIAHQPIAYALCFAGTSLVSLFAGR